MGGRRARTQECALTLQYTLFYENMVGVFMKNCRVHVGDLYRKKVMDVEMAVSHALAPLRA